jgi:hypothetical protein
MEKTVTSLDGFEWKAFPEILVRTILILSFGMNIEEASFWIEISFWGMVIVIVLDDPFIGSSEMRAIPFLTVVC